MKLLYKKGDATSPRETGKVLLVHGVNDSGKFGSGIAGMISQRFPYVREKYMEWATNGFTYNGKERIPFRLGEIQVVSVNKNFYICNLVSQRNTYKFKDLIPFRHESFYEGMLKVKDYVDKNNFDIVVMPRIGCGLALTTFNKVEPLIKKSMKDFPVVIYDIEPIDGTIYQ